MKIIFIKFNLFFYKIFLSIILIYQKAISPILPARCRYYPTCSHYGQQAIKWHGVWRGSWLLLKRLGRCHPLGGHGIDFVPLPLATYRYQYVPYHAISCAGISFYPYIYRDRYSYVARLNAWMATR